ncbi:MAG: ADP-ribosylglycohydrolase family protein, partial [Halanaerobiales bacterium]
MTLYLSEEKYRDKVYGCWLGKNAGGTLGEPLEKRFGQEEMFNVDWYPELPEEGLPNDDLEIQLIWLQALQEKGPGLTARDLVEYWLDCICYNFDEYGLHKTNLKKGLMPPVSGWYNNWFKNCMGSPIRSEIWACVAPGAPEVAARYAFEDSICDHAGGESVHGEIFNAVVESAAFLIEDKFDLIEIGLNAIPEDSLTHQTVTKTLDLYNKGVDWKKARNIILDEFYNPIAQFSPINLAFQTIGWLYGKDFGNAICKAVNCGWDTDCTGATLGAILGIVHGADNLPDKWMEPLGTEISTNVRTGGITNLEAPTDIAELTDEVCNMGKKVLNYWNSDINISDANIEENITEKINPRVFTSSFNFEKHLDYKASTLEFDLDTIEVDLEYKNTPAVIGNKATPFSVAINNPHPESLSLQVDIDLPDNWSLQTEAPTVFELGADSKIKLNYKVTADENNIEMRNEGLIKIKV